MSDLNNEEMTKQHTHIIGIAKDLMVNFLYYHRKEDDTLPIGTIERSILNHVISIDDIVNVFEEALSDSVDRYKGSK